MSAEDVHDAARLAGDLAVAWNACDAEALLALTHPDFRMYRMKGDVIDRDGLREAIARQRYGAAMKLLPRRLYGGNGRFAVAARVEFRHVDGDELLGFEEDGGIGFELRDRLILTAAPKASLREALTWADVIDETPVAAWDAPAGQDTG